MDPRQLGHVLRRLKNGIVTYRLVAEMSQTRHDKALSGCCAFRDNPSDQVCMSQTLLAN